MKFLNWLNVKNYNEDLEKLVSNILYLIENEEIENEPEEQPEDDFSSDPFADGDENAAPAADFTSELEAERNKEKKYKKRIIKNARESMMNLRLKAMLRRKSLIGKLKKLNPNDHSVIKYLKKLGYNASKHKVEDVLQAAMSEQGNDVPEDKIQLLKSIKMSDARAKYMQSVADLYKLYQQSMPEFYTDEMMGDVIIKLMKYLTNRVVTRANKAKPWSSIAAFVDPRLSSVIKTVGSVVKSSKIDDLRNKTRREKKEQPMSGLLSPEEDERRNNIMTGASTDFTSSGNRVGGGADPDSEVSVAVRTSIQELPISANKRNIIAFLVYHGLDSIAEDYDKTGNLDVPRDLSISLVHKINKSGTTSHKPDMQVIKQKLQGFGITATDQQISSWKSAVSDVLRRKIETKLGTKLESLSFSNWLLINEFLLGGLKDKAQRFAGKVAVGVKRAGEFADKVLGDDPYSRQRTNREKHKDHQKWSKIMDDMGKEAGLDPLK